MRSEALFLNGVYQDCLDGILEFQSELPEQILFMQPYSGDAIVHLRDNPPSIDDPVRLLASVTTDLSSVYYVAEIVGWNDKRSLSDKKRHVLNRLIWTLLPWEGGLYDAFRVDNAPSVNLLHVQKDAKTRSTFLHHRVGENE